MQLQQDHTINQAAKILQANPQTVRTAINKGYLKCYKVSPRNTRITPEALDEFRENGGMPQIKGSTTS